MNESKLFQWMMAYGLRMNENRLSDVVWALCKVDENFLKFFFRFIFEAPSVKVDIIEREAVQEGGRNDFVFYTNKGKYILESKIGDTTINANHYMAEVHHEAKRIKYILAFENEGRYGKEWKTCNNELINSKDKNLHFKYKMWNDFAKELLEKSPNPDWKLLGAFIQQTLYQKECKIDNLFNSFDFNNCGLKLFQNKKEETLPKLWDCNKAKDNWKEGSDYGYFLDNDEKIWYGYVYTPIDAEGTILVLSIRDYEFRSKFKKHGFQHPAFNHITPIGSINTHEGWYYFKIKQAKKVDEAIKELKDFLSTRKNTGKE